MSYLEYQLEEFTGPTVDDYAADLEGDAAAAEWDATQDRDREVAYYERLAFSNPQDEKTIEAQQWLADYPRNPVHVKRDFSDNGYRKATNLGDLISAKQLSQIRTIANDSNVDVAAECRELLGCSVSELSKRGASELIDHLRAKMRQLTPAARAA